MPLQNRVTPFAEIVADPTRGLLMGNRSGRLHEPRTKTLGERRWTSKAWICCVTSFKNRHRRVMGASYTELFFLDEVTALAVGHRPCFECRRHDALRFAGRWADAAGLQLRMSAPHMDSVLHGERLDKRSKKLHPSSLDGLPDGVMLVLDKSPWAVRGRRLWRWTHEGYLSPIVRPAGVTVPVLTPPSIVAALRAGYQPVWHSSAGLLIPSGADNDPFDRD